ncbi:hypothetical protein [Chitinophaga deserti]|uniref:hypothetical protein n=1 Tax=Chitinophaga deserti TaxID=2164099 RepID=UPI000D6B18A3|nr:hypothetical protein [Chitinophaga deserti]
MDIRNYIDNGMVESYVLGLSSPDENAEMRKLLREYPELETERDEVERIIHKLLNEEAVQPPVALRSRALQPLDWADTNAEKEEKKPNYTFINIAPNQNQYITVHRVWKWIFIASFLLFKAFLFLAIFFYFKYRQVEDRQQEREKIRLEQQQQSRAAQTVLI